MKNYLKTCGALFLCAIFFLLGIATSQDDVGLPNSPLNISNLSTECTLKNMGVTSISEDNIIDTIFLLENIILPLDTLTVSISLDENLREFIYQCNCPSDTSFQNIDISISANMENRAIEADCN